jgi:uncharacterized membrane protein
MHVLWSVFGFLFVLVLAILFIYLLVHALRYLVFALKKENVKQAIELADELNRCDYTLDINTMHVSKSYSDGALPHH